MTYPRGLQDTSICSTGKQQKACTSETESAPKVKNPRTNAELTETPQRRKKSTHEATALRYAGRGLPVFPLHSVDDQGRCSCGGRSECKPGKHPRIPNGHIGATRDQGRIRRWWSRWPDANIGIPAGEQSGLLVLDVDDWGPGTLNALEDEHGKLPETLTVRTGGGGIHALFKYPPGCGIRNSAGRVGLGLDVRGEGGYIVAPPSRTDKGTYAVLERLPLAEPPEWLLEAMRTPSHGSEGRRGDPIGTLTPDLDGPPLPEGSRNQALTRVAGLLRARGMGPEGMEATLRSINATRCAPPLPEAEVSGIARSVARYPAGDASPEPPPEVLRNVEALFASVLGRLEWKGRGGPTDRAVYAALLITARRHGRASRGGVKVYVSVRALALAAGVSRPTAMKALDRLRGRKLVYRASEGRGTKAGALILRVAQATQAFTTQPRKGVSVDSGQPLRSHFRELLRLRWGPGRVGKLRALLLDVIARTGEATLDGLSERTGRRRCDVRRSLKLLEARALVECAGETYRLVPEFSASLDRELEATGILRAEHLDHARYERQREAYRERFTSRHLRKPDGRIGELRRVEPEPENPPADSPAPVPSVASVSEVFAMARERFGLPEPPEAPPVPDKDSPAVFVAGELHGVEGMRYREMKRSWKELGGETVALEEAIREGPYRFRREPLDFNQPYVYRTPKASRRESAA